jgi:predicted ribosomally synthesized peptide with nif11-like leader
LKVARFLNSLPLLSRYQLEEYMSIESAKALYSRMTTDEAFRAQLEQAANKEERNQVLQAAGYNFTPEEWHDVTAKDQASTSADSELNDEELAAVSGGGVFDFVGDAVDAVGDAVDTYIVEPYNEAVSNTIT